MANVLPPQACAFVAPAAADAAPTCFIGLAVHGDRKSLEQLLKAAEKQGLQGNLLENENPLEAMIYFAGSQRRRALSLFHDAVAGRFGRLQVEVIVAAAKDARDGIDMEKEILVAPSSYFSADLK